MKSNAVDVKLANLKQYQALIGEAIDRSGDDWKILKLAKLSNDTVNFSDDLYIVKRPSKHENYPPRYAVFTKNKTNFIGRGNFGSVYRLNLACKKVQSKWVFNDSKKVLKIITQQHQDSSTSYENLLRELTVFKSQHNEKAHINHAEKFSLMFMQRIDGLNLEEKTQQAHHSLPFLSTLEIVISLLHEVQTLHKNGYIHGDLKPANIILQPDNQVKLVDFGVARLIGEKMPDTDLGDLYFYPQEVINLYSHQSTILATTSIDKYALAGTFAKLFGASHITWSKRSPGKKLIADNLVKPYALHGLFQHMQNIPADTRDAIKQVITSLSDPDCHKRPELDQIDKTLTQIKQNHLDYLQHLKSQKSTPGAENLHAHSLFTRQPAKSVGYVTLACPLQENRAQKQP